MSEFILHGGMIVSESEVVAADLWVADGKVAGWLAPGAGERLAAERPDVRLVSAHGLYILPGLIDVHVHLREPGLEHKEDFVSGTEAAALGGVTTVLDMPNTLPPVSGRKELEEKIALANGRLVVDVGFYGVVSQGNLDAIGELAAAGAFAFKMFLGPTTGEIRPPEHGALFAAFEEVARTGRPLVVHAEDREVIEYWQGRLMGLGDTYGHFLQSRPEYGEAAATELAIRLAEASGARVHIAHVATAEGVDVLRTAKERCDHVTCETCPHYLALTEADWPRLGNKLKILPPVRSSKDQKRLWEAVQDGVIDMIATDHAPHLDSERADKNLWEAPAGAAGLETMLPLLLDWVNRGRLSLPDVVRLTSERPAKIFGLAPRKGSLRPGADADLVLVDMMQRRVLRGEGMRTRAKSTPFEGMEVQGVPVATYLRGHLVASQGDLIQTERRGKVLKPGD